MRSMTESCWPLLKRSRLGGTTYKTISIKFLCLQTITASNASWILKTWALGKSGGPKSCQDTTSRLIIDKAKLTELLIPYLVTLSRVLRKKKPYKLRTQRSCTDCNLHHYKSRSWVSWVWASPPPCTKFLSARQLSYHSYVSFGILFKQKFVHCKH